MKGIILISSILIMASASNLCGQGSVDIVYGHVGYEKQNGVEIMYTMAYPVIDILKSDEEAVVTAGIPPVFVAGGTVATHLPGTIAGILLFPNPVSEVLYVERETVGQDYVVQLYDVNGIEIQRRNWTAGDQSLEMQMSDIVSGQYVLKITDTDMFKSTHFKVLKLK